MGFVVRPHPENRSFFDIGYYDPEGEWIFCHRDFDLYHAMKMCAYYNGSGHPEMIERALNNPQPIPQDEVV